MLNQIIDLLLAIPGLRFLFGLVHSSLRPFLAVLLLAGTLYLLSRVAHYASLRRATRIIADENFWGPAARLVVAPPDRPALKVEPVLTEPVLADTVGEEPVSAAPVIGQRRQPWVPEVIRVRTALSLAAVVVVLVTLALTRHEPEKPAPIDEIALLKPAADTAFRFEDTGWRTEEGACLATLRAIALGHAQRSLTLYVMDSSGSVIGEQSVRSPALSVGAMVDFRFPRLDCARVKEWQVQGEPLK